jgi:hypothetical protein
MGQYINNTSAFNNYGSSISYNFDTVQFMMDAATPTLSMKTETSDSTTTKLIEYDVITHYINKIDLSLPNTINLKITNNYTQSDDYLLTDLYIAKVNDNSLGILNNDIALTIDEAVDSEPPKYMYRYSIITRFSPLKGNSLSVEDNIYIITPLLYTNQNVNTVTQSSNIQLNVNTIRNKTITELKSPEIIISNINNINEIIKPDSDYFFIDSIDKIIIFKNPLYLSLKKKGYTGNFNEIPTPNEFLYVTSATEYIDSINSVNSSSSTISKNNAIGQTSANLDSNIYINCHPVDESGRLVPKSNNTQKSNKDIKISIIFFGVFFSCVIIAYTANAYFKKELDGILDFSITNESITSIRIKFGVLFMVFIISWVFIGINIDDMPN